MVSAGDVVVVNGKPQIVESVFNGGYVSRPAQPSELTNRSLPSTISPEYNPNLPQNQSPPPAAPQEVRVLGGDPAAKDEASMYAEGYEYKGQENGQQVWQRWQHPKAAGTYTSPAGDTWEIEQANQTIMRDGKAVATFAGQNVFYSTYAPSNEGQLPSEQIQQAAAKPNPLSNSFVNPFNPSQIITTTYSSGNERGLLDLANKNIRIETSYKNTPDWLRNAAIAGSPYWFEYGYMTVSDFLSDSPFATAEERASKKAARDAFVKEKYYEIKGNPDKFSVAVQYAAQSPGGIAAQGVMTGFAFTGLSRAAAATGSPAVIGTFKGISYGLGSIYAGEKIAESIAGYKTSGMQGALKPAAEAAIFLAGAKTGEELYDTNIAKDIRGRIYKSDITIQSPETKSAIVDPRAEKSGFVIESESYAVRTRTFLGSIKIRDIVDVSKVRTAGMIESIGEDTSRITAQSEHYSLNPKTDAENVVVSEVRGEAQTKTLLEKDGLKTTVDRLRIAEGSKDAQAAAAFRLLTQEKSRTKNIAGHDVLRSDMSIRGLIVEARRGEKNPVMTLRGFEDSEFVETIEMRAPGMREVDLSRAGKTNKKVPDWLFDKGSMKQKIPKIKIENLDDLKKGNIYEKGSSIKGFGEFKKMLEKHDAVIDIELNSAQSAKGRGMRSSALAAIGKISKEKMVMRQINRISDYGKPAAADHPTLLGLNPNIAASGYDFKRLIKVPKKSDIGSKLGLGGMHSMGSRNPERISNEPKIGMGTFSLTPQGQSQLQSQSEMQGQQQNQSQETYSPGRSKTTTGVRNIPKPKISIEGGTMFGGFTKTISDEKKKRRSLAGKGFMFKLPKKRYSKVERLQPSPIQADVSKALYGKATAPRPTRAILNHATISVPTAEQVRHKTR